ncbi:MAG TPA: ATP-binding protein, partial [Alphaproteobacteria bacterium]|nr:ATP-binding protein [Alphaproteobacteria bacterium]
VRLSFDRPPGVLALNGDPRLLRQLLINLVSNAVKFTPMGGSVEVTIDRPANGDLRIVVADTGIGIAQQDMGRVMEPFVQVENSMSRGRPGTGLGLPLSVRIAELHGGSLDLSSRIGMGTSAVLTLPADRIVQPMAEAPPARIDTKAGGNR